MWSLSSRSDFERSSPHQPAFEVINIIPIVFAPQIKILEQKCSVATGQRKKQKLQKDAEGKCIIINYLV